MTARDECDCGGGGRVPCPNCDGEGFVIVCPDDLCQNSGECIHGDGEVECRQCMGSGWVVCGCEIGKMQEDR